MRKEAAGLRPPASNQSFSFENGRPQNGPPSCALSAAAASGAVAAAIMLFLRLTGGRIFSIDTKGQDLHEIVHHPIHFLAGYFVIDHVGILHYLCINRTELLIKILHFFFAGLFLLRFLLIVHLNQVKLADEVVEGLVGFVCLTGLFEIQITPQAVQVL